MKGPISMTTESSPALSDLEEPKHRTVDELEAASADAALEPRGDAPDHPTAGAD
jgi:hypothetical protein